MESSTGSRVSYQSNRSNTREVRFYTAAGLPIPVRSRSPLLGNLKRSGSVPVSLTSTGSTPVSTTVTPVSTASDVKTSPTSIDTDPVPSTGLSSGISQMQLDTVGEPREEESVLTEENMEIDPENSLTPKTSPVNSNPGQITSPSDYTDAQTFIADNAGEMWLGDQNDDVDPEPSQPSQIFHASVRFHIDDSSSDSNGTTNVPFAGSSQISAGFHPDSSPSTADASDALKSEQPNSSGNSNDVTQTFDSQTYHSASEDSQEKIGMKSPNSNSNQNSNVGHDHSSSSSDTTGSALSHNTSSTQSSSTPTRSQPSPVLPAQFGSPFESQKRILGSTMANSVSPRQGLPQPPLSPARVKRVKQENRTYTIKKIGDTYQSIYNFVEMRSFENRTLHIPRESQQYREKGG